MGCIGFRKPLNPMTLDSSKMFLEGFGNDPKACNGLRLAFMLGKETLTQQGFGFRVQVIYPSLRCLGFG